MSALQCCVGVCHARAWASHGHTSVPFLLNLPPTPRGGRRAPGLSSLPHPANPPPAVCSSFAHEGRGLLFSRPFRVCAPDCRCSLNTCLLNATNPLGEASPEGAPEWGFFCPPRRQWGVQYYRGLQQSEGPVLKGWGWLRPHCWGKSILMPGKGCQAVQQARSPACLTDAAGFGLMWGIKQTRPLPQWHLPSTSANRGRAPAVITKWVEFREGPTVLWGGMIGFRVMRLGQQGGLCEGAAFSRKRGPWDETGTLVDNWRDKKFSAEGPGAGGWRPQPRSGKETERSGSGGCSCWSWRASWGRRPLGRQEVTVVEKLRMPVVDLQRWWVWTTLKR